MKLCSIPFIFGLIALQLLLLSTIVSAQQARESCTSTLPLNNFTFDMSLLQCSEVWISQNYILRYAKTEENTWNFILSAPDSSAYIGIGFSTKGRMVGSSAIVGWIPSNGDQGGVKKYFLGGKSPDEVIPDQGDLRIVNGTLKIQSISSRLYISFQLTAELPQENLLYAMGPADFFPSLPDFRLREHQVMTTTTIKYNTGSATLGPTTSPSPPTTQEPPSSKPSSAHSLSPSLLLFGISLVALKFY